MDGMCLKAHPSILRRIRMTETAQTNETIEDLQLNGLKLIQKSDAFRFGMDSVLLAEFARIGPEDTVADLGTGNGVLVLLLHGRGRGKRYLAVDIQEEAAELAVRNMKLNKLEDKVKVICADAGNLSTMITECSVDAAICNPPYGQPDASLTSPKKNKALARSQSAETLDHLLYGAFRILKGRGRLFMVYPASQMLFLMKQLQHFHLEPKRFQMVYPRSDRPANLVLIEAVKDAKPMLHTLPPLIIYESDGSLTNNLKSVYHIE